MQLRTKVIVGAAIAASAIGLAIATPILNLASPIVSTGVDESRVHEYGVAQTTDGWFNATLTTDGPSTITVQEAAYSATGQNGWHSHPGLVIVTLISGMIVWYNANCEPTTYHAGDAWMEGSQEHAFKVVGTTGIQLSAVYVIAKGEAARIDKPAPACAEGLGL